MHTMTNADIITELKQLKEIGHPVSAIVLLYAGMVDVRHFDRPGCSAREAALALLQMVRTVPDKRPAWTSSAEIHQCASATATNDRPE